MTFSRAAVTGAADVVPDSVPDITLPGLEHPAELLKRMEFEILRRLDGFLFGDYTGLFYGPSLDLAEVREYQPGDEVRRIDWNVTARTGTLHVRQYREEREVSCLLIVDLSPSMSFGTRRVSKIELALEFIALASAVQMRRGNKVGALGYSRAGTVPIPFATGRRQPLKLVRTLVDSLSGRDGVGRFGDEGSANEGSASEGSDLASALGEASRTLRRKALIFVISDFVPLTHEGVPGWIPKLRRLAATHDAIAVQVSDPLERRLPDLGEIRFRDPETGEEIWFDSADAGLRARYQDLAAQRQSELERILRESRVDLLELSTAREVVEPIIRFTLARRGRRGARQ